MKISVRRPACGDTLLQICEARSSASISASALDKKIQSLTDKYADASNESKNLEYVIERIPSNRKTSAMDRTVLNAALHPVWY